MMQYYDKGEDWSKLKKIEYENRFKKVNQNPIEKLNLKKKQF